MGFLSPSSTTRQTLHRAAEEPCGYIVVIHVLTVQNSVGPATANSWLVAASLADDQLATANVSASSYSYPKYGILASLSCSCASWQLSHQLSQVIDSR